MTLHENPEQFKQAILLTAQQIDISEIYVEKDYWVTYALYTIFHNEIGKHTVFKGGTALLKCDELIQRFSEDIDLVILRQGGESSNQLGNKVKRISKAVSDILPEVQVVNITQKMGMNRKTAHTYPKVFSGEFGQIREIIVVEATWLGYFEPYITRNISSFIYRMLQNAGQEIVAKQYGLLPFEVLVLDPKRTFCEKIMSLIRFSYTSQPLNDLRLKVRHTYDLHRLLQLEEFVVFFDSKQFDEMLLKVANDDVKSYKNNNLWLQYHPNNALIFADTETVWTNLKEAYNGAFRDLVYGEFPKDEEVLITLLRIRDRVARVEWIVNL
ncbi:nucleotidyl transferase AbiEii/AbiGii toxin family protein [Arcicella sp. LKC2W]|uniref:nucleotidyl transferase AbiEii/AbiGii toxin family protein n=1 Tax=Arcicella sp. LKC2W TaxID=2984198 RepID=UPI002B211414|nr:nucleotidyl transferase AbiEii/AbiGii toxin family protein [Arcicella sp. LKC2W]MEA5460324.1 nucleotidyl transferase AbiEii/AbiGii toxin family protein [Arcicella sp. LKC2W]